LSRWSNWWSFNIIWINSHRWLSNKWSICWCSEWKLYKFSWSYHRSISIIDSIDNWKSNVSKLSLNKRNKILLTITQFTKTGQRKTKNSREYYFFLKLKINFYSIFFSCLIFNCCAQIFACWSVVCQYV
jgi:hypothetical protein